MARRLLLAVFLVAAPAVAVVAAIREGRERDLRDLLLRARDADRSVSYRCTRAVMWEGRTMRMQLLHRAPDETRVVREGRARREHDRDRDHGRGRERGREALRGGLRGHWNGFPLLDVDLALKNYDARMTADGVRLTPRHAGRNALTLHLDEASGLAVGWDLTDPSGALVMKASSEGLDTRPTFTAEEFPAEHEWRGNHREGRGPQRGREGGPQRGPQRGFEFERGGALWGGGEAVTVLRPRALPEGFRPMEMGHGAFPGHAARFLWTDGIAVVSLVEFHAREGEGPAAGGGAADGTVTVERHACGGKNLLVGRLGGTTFVVMGTLPEAELRDMISSFEIGATE